MLDLMRPVAACLIVTLALLPCTGEEAKPLPRAHAHNDYLHDRPLLDALENGFCSVEADVFLVDGELLVAHTRAELDRSRTFEKLYLAPLRERVRSHDGRVHIGGPVFTLLIDIKSDGASTYDAIHQQLSRYPDVFSSVQEGKLHAAAVTAIISGNRPKERIASSSPRFAGIDGRLADLDSDLPAHLLPLISDNWRSHFRWRGEGKMPVEEQRKLKKIVAAAHAKNRRVRFWATPDVPAVWNALNQSGVDLINTDDLSGLRHFLEQAGNETVE